MRRAERCRSGRTGQTRNLLSLLRGTVGSNPTLSARLLEVRVCALFSCLPGALLHQAVPARASDLDCCAPAQFPSALLPVHSNRPQPAFSAGRCTATARLLRNSPMQSRAAITLLFGL